MEGTVSADQKPVEYSNALAGLLPVQVQNGVLPAAAAVPAGTTSRRAGSELLVGCLSEVSMIDYLQLHSPAENETRQTRCWRAMP